MLYISRCLGARRWSVMDTDDYTETACTMKDLERYCLELGVVIKGVDVRDTLETSVRGVVKHVRHIRGVSVYQDEMYMTSLQTKSAFLKGVSIKTLGTEIVSITAENMKDGAFEVVRLSDYGESCGNRILQSLIIPSGCHLVLVIDDKIKLKRFTFKGIEAVNYVLLDLTELTNEKIRENLYTLNRFRHGYNEFEGYIADRKETIDFYKGVGLVVNGPGIHSASTTIASLLSEPGVVCKKLAERYASLFSGIFNVELKFEDTDSTHRRVVNYLIQPVIKSSLQMIQECSLDFVFLRRWSLLILSILYETGNSDEHSVRMLCNYMAYFDVSNEYRSSFLKLCRNTIETVHKFALDRMWVKV